VAAQDFSYTGATFQARQIPARLACAPRPSWREITVLERDAKRPTVPWIAGNPRARPSRGMASMAQHALGDVVLFRDKNGQVQIHAL
jgi:hypothetical protein